MLFLVWGPFGNKPCGFKGYPSKINMSEFYMQHYPMYTYVLFIVLILQNKSYPILARELY